MSKRKAESQQISASSDKKAKSVTVCCVCFCVDGWSQIFGQIVIDKEAHQQCMKETMEADLRHLLVSKDAHYAKKLEAVLWNSLYQKGEHVFWGPRSPFLDPIRRELDSNDEYDEDELVETFGSFVGEVEKSLSDLGWKRVEWSCSDLFSDPGKFYCKHCVSGLEPTYQLCDF
jgi:hypothetical protein